MRAVLLIICICVTLAMRAEDMIPGHAITASTPDTEQPL